MPRIGNNPLLLGFEDIERMLDRIAKNAGDGYPPYNIERIQAVEGENERIRIVLAVAGFTLDQLEVTVAGKELAVRGVQRPDKPRSYLHRGIAARPFQRSFVLADGLSVLTAELDNGLLNIELMRPEPNKSMQRIEIKERS